MHSRVFRGSSMMSALGALALGAAACTPASAPSPTSAPAAAAQASAPTAPAAAAAKPATAATPAQATASGDIVIGASLPTTGPLAPFGQNVQIGYQRAFDDVNKAGGLDVGGTKHQVSLVLLDNQSDSNMAADQARTLFQRNNAVRSSVRRRHRSIFPSRTWPNS